MKRTIIYLMLFIIQVIYAQDEIIINGNPCGIYGSAKVGTTSYYQNYFKNRYKLPTANDIDNKITIEDILTWKVTKDSVNQYKAVDITGYVLKVKPTEKESCNCMTDDPQLMDTHIELTPNSKETGKNKIVVVEVTPRFRQMYLKNGIDWSTSALKKNIEGHLVRIQGWLFCDRIHASSSFADNPENPKNWRGTVWEVHPITYIEVLDAGEENANFKPFTDDNDNINQFTQPVLTVANEQNPKTNKQNTNMETAQTPYDTLIMIILGAILGAVGQGIRVVVGIKKVNDAKSENEISENIMQYKQLAFSLFIGFSVGAIAGVLAAVANTNHDNIRTVMITFITAGYAGTDFIEGFMKKNSQNLTKSNNQ